MVTNLGFPPPAVRTRPPDSAPKRPPRRFPALERLLFPPPKPKRGPASPSTSDLPAFAPPFALLPKPVEKSEPSAPDAAITDARTAIPSSPSPAPASPVHPAHFQPNIPRPTEPVDIPDFTPAEELTPETQPPDERRLVRRRRKRSGSAGIGTGRFEPLDVLRGWAVLGMALSGMVPAGTLPAWMYHAQLPPPTGAFNDKVYGITWVDLVFPFFLFAMGAAIPMSLGGRLDGGQSMGRVVLGLLGRGLLLSAYAIIGQHLRPYVLSGSPNTEVWRITLAGFVFIALMLMRWPRGTPPTVRFPLTAAGWIGALWLLSGWTYPDGSTGFANYRNDVILLVLANVAVSGGLIWLLTQKSPGARWTCFGIVAAIFLTRNLPGLGQAIWKWDPTEYFSFRHTPDGRFLPVFYHFEFHKYLLVVLPGTFVGDMIRSGSARIAPVTKPFGALWAEFALTLVGPIAAAAACIGLLAREVITTTLGLAGVSGVVWFLISRYSAVYEGLAARLFRFGAPLLLVGLLAEPIDGGIRKDEPTLSYYFVTAGLGAICVCSLTCLWYGIRRNPAWRLFSSVGVNPIMGYLIITNLTMGLVGISGLEAMITGATKDPGQLLAWACVKTLFVALATAFFTRMKIFLRA